MEEAGSLASSPATRPRRSGTKDGNGGGGRRAAKKDPSKNLDEDQVGMDEDQV